MRMIAGRRARRLGMLGLGVAALLVAPAIAGCAWMGESGRAVEQRLMHRIEQVEATLARRQDEALERAAKAQDMRLAEAAADRRALEGSLARLALDQQAALERAPAGDAAEERRRLEGRIAALERRAGATAAAPPGDLDARLARIEAAVDDRELREAQANARFERLERKTQALPWPNPDAKETLHLASYRSYDAAVRGWQRLKARYPGDLARLEPTFAQMRTVHGRFIRLTAGEGADRERLVELRERVRAGGDYAQLVPVSEGQPLFEAVGARTPMN